MVGQAPEGSRTGKKGFGLTFKERFKKFAGKAAGSLVRGAYTEYVSTTTGRERRWRTF